MPTKANTEDFKVLCQQLLEVGVAIANYDANNDDRSLRKNVNLAFDKWAEKAEKFMERFAS